MSNEEERLLAQAEGMLLNVAQMAGGLDPLMRVFFGFLHKRTDFYNVIPEDVGAAKLGFREGAARRMVLQAFEAYPFKDLSGAPLNLVHSAGPPRPPSSADGARRASAMPAAAAAAAEEGAAKEKKRAAAQNQKQQQKESEKKPEKKTEKKSELSTLATEVELTEDGKQLPIAGNGGVTDRYYWHQSLQELTVYVQLPAGSQVKDIQCSIKAKGLCVRLAGAESAVLEGSYPAPERVKADESLWSFEGATDTLVLSLEKTRETWWDSILEGEPAIDTTQVDSTRAIDEYDESTQAGIRKVMFDQRQKKLGLPTSDEITASNILDKARHLPGSPFLTEDP